jgi:hypothetical protein
MKIANIIYEDELVNHKEQEFINYYKSGLTYEQVDTSLPTLYVGWFFMKKNNPNNDIIQNITILNNCVIKNKLYWTFSFDEEKSIHINGVSDFVKYSPYYNFDLKYRYDVIDPVFFKLKNNEDLFPILPNTMINVYQHTNKMIYVFDGVKVSGIDLQMFNFFKFNIDQIIEIIKSKSNNYIYDPDGSIYIKYQKIFPQYPYVRRYLPVILLK